MLFHLLPYSPVAWSHTLFVICKPRPFIQCSESRIYEHRVVIAESGKPLLCQYQSVWLWMLSSSVFRMSSILDFIRCLFYSPRCLLAACFVCPELSSCSIRSAPTMSNCFCSEKYASRSVWLVLHGHWVISWIDIPISWDSYGIWFLSRGRLLSYERVSNEPGSYLVIGDRKPIDEHSRIMRPM